MSLPKNHFFFFTSTRAMGTSLHLTEADALVQSVGDCLVEGFLDLDRPSLIEGELDDQPVRAALDSHIGRIDEQGVLGNHLEAIILGCAECRDHRVQDRNEEGRVVGHISLHLFNFSTHGLGEELH
jgi:hypothetical protein